MKVFQKMTSNPVCIQATSFAEEALSLLHSYSIRHLIVLNGYRPIGVLSINDFPQFIKPQLSVMDIMTINRVIVVNEKDDINFAKELLYRNRIGCLPVINDTGTLTGIITKKNLN